MLYQQFAVAVSVAMLISAINALSLSPALCSLLLKHGSKPNRIIQWMQRGIDKGRDAYVTGCSILVRRALVTGVLLVLSLGLAGWLGKLTPTGFLPDEDQGAFFTELQLPAGASVNRTQEVSDQVTKILAADPNVTNVLAVPGYSMIDGLVLSNRAFFIASLKPFGERQGRENAAQAVIARAQKQLNTVNTGFAFAFNLPPIIGLGTGSGFEYQLLDLQGASIEALAQVSRGLVIAANQDPDLTAMRTTFSVSTPQFKLDLDRERLQMLGVNVSDVFAALQATLGGYYVNDYNQFGRTWSVMLQARPQDRMEADDIFRVNVRNNKGDMVPLRAVASGNLEVATASLTRYNNLRSTTITGEPAPGVASGSALAAMEQISATTLSGGLWLRMDRHRAPGKGSRRQDRLHLRAFHSLRVPVPRGALRELDPAGRRHALGRHRGRRGHGRSAACGPAQQHLCADRPRRARRARGQERHPDLRIRHGRPQEGQADPGGRDRGRTSALSRRHDDELRLHPRPRAAGDRDRCGRPSRRAVGTAVFGGMLAAAVLGIFLIPGLYRIAQELREKVHGFFGGSAGPEPLGPPEVEASVVKPVAPVATPAAH